MTRTDAGKEIQVRLALLRGTIAKRKTANRTDATRIAVSGHSTIDDGF